MKTITIFLASSKELENDRNSLQALMASLDDIYEPRGIRIKCKRWEDFISYCTGERTQDQYNIVVKGSDICICMFHRKAGEYTREEFKHAMAEYAQNKERPKTYVYVRALVDGEIEEEELKTFKKELFDKIGHYWCNYDTDDMMKLHFVMQLERLMSPSLLGVAMHDASNLKVEDGKVLLHGRKIADYSNLPFASLNSDYKRLKERIESLNKDILLFRSMGVPGLESEIFSRSEERSKCQEDLRKLEEQLFSIALTANRIISSGETISERKRMAIEMFERGNIRGVIDVLNEEDLSFDEEQARSEVLRGRQIKESGKEMEEDGIKKIRSLVEVYMMRAEALMADYSEPERFSLSCKSYEKAISLAREYLAAEELVEVLMSYAFYFYRMKRLDEAKKILVESLDYFDDSLECKVKAAAVYGMLGEVYSEILPMDVENFNKSFNHYKKAIEIYDNMVDGNLYDQQIANIYVSIGGLYYSHRDMNESHIDVSEKYFEKAKDIYQKAPDEDVDSKYCYALVLNNLGSIYCFCKDENDKAEEYYTKALDIYKSIKGFNPLYQEDLARLYRNLGSLYFKKGDLDESKIFYNDSLYEYKGLYDNNPILYEIELQRIYNEMRLFYGHWYNDGQYDKAYKLSVLLYVIASHIYEGNKSETNIELYTDSLVNISYYLLLCQEYEKSEYYSRKALEVDPEKIYAFTNLAHALLLQEGKTDEAIEIYLKYKDTLKDDFINDLNELEKLDVIPEERKEFVMKIKQIIETME